MSIERILRRSPLRRAEGGLTLLAIGLIVLVPLIAAANAAGELAESVSDHNGISAFDGPMLDWMVAHRTEAATLIAEFLSMIADVAGGIILAFAAIIALCWWRRSWTPLLVIGVGMTGSVAATLFGKHAVGRLRPPESLAAIPGPTSPAFPSGHSLNATVFACLTAYLVVVTAKRLWLAWAASVAALAYVVAVGWSRVYLGHHWLTDVLMGWALGIAWAAVLVLAHQAACAWQRHRRAVVPA